MKQIITIPPPRKTGDNQEAREQETDEQSDEWIEELIDLIDEAADSEELDPQDKQCIIAEILRPAIADLDPADRRVIVASAAVDSLPQRKKTGQFFNALAGAPQRPYDETELGRRIMATRNVNYQPKEGEQG